MIWQPGMQAKCVKTGDWVFTVSQQPASAVVNRPTSGQTYNVRDVVETRYGPYLLLVEVTNPKDKTSGFEPSFDGKNFTPVGQAPDPIEQFRRLVTPAAIATFKDPCKVEEKS